MSEYEENNYVLCMGCQGSFHMDKCKPIGDSGYGFVYCPKCFQLRSLYLQQIRNYAKFMYKAYPDLSIKVALIDINNQIVEILGDE